MSNEHNPIAQLVTQIQQKWAAEVSPHPEFKLIRWLIDPDQSKLYEGFLHLESTAHGKLPEMFVALFTPFRSKELHTNDLVRSWLEAYDKDQETFDQLRIKDPSYKWNNDNFRKKILSGKVSTEELFLEMLQSFYSAVEMPGRMLTVALMPHAVHNIKEYEEWLRSLMKLGIPDSIQVCIFDYASDGYFDNLCRKYPDITWSLTAKLDLDGAVNKIIQAGDPNAPDVQLRKYILKMSDAVSAGDLAKLNRLGGDCITAMTNTKIKSLMATAYIVYAGLLFNFKRHDEIEVLLHKGLKIAEAGKLSGDGACQSLILQYYGFIASNYQLKKKEKQAMDWFSRQALLSVESGLPIPAITAWRQAAWLAKKNDPVFYKDILLKAYNTGEKLSNEELSISDFSFLALEYYDYLLSKRETDACERIEQKMIPIYGEDWKIQTRERSKSPASKETNYATSQ